MADRPTSKEQLISSIKAILKDADLSSLSAKKIRKMLETEYSADFTERKGEIDDMVMKLITADSEEEEKDENGVNSDTNDKQRLTNGASKSAKPPSPKKATKEDIPANKGQTCSDEDEEENDDDDDESDLDDTEDVVPKKKAKVQPSAKASKASPKKVNDEELAKQLQDDESVRPSRRCKAQPVVRKQKKPRKESAKGTSVYSRPCALLPPLDGVLDTDRMPRPMIVKRLWQIVKERDLLDPKNKQFMLCDEQMLGLFGRPRVRMFGVMKLLKPYIKDLPKD